MKREEKNKIVIRKILDSAQREFGSEGYGLSSINNICTNGGISNYLAEHSSDEGKDPEEKLRVYFDARRVFFEQNPLQQTLFCSAVISPPSHLVMAIKEVKQGFDAFNTPGVIWEQMRKKKQIQLYQQ